MAFMGMRGTGDWVADQRPKNFREGILYLFPNGDAPLTGFLGKLAEESVTDPEFYWWTKNLPQQGGTVTGVYNDVALSSAYTSGAVLGQQLFIKMAELLASEFKITHQVLLRDSDRLDVDVNAKVTAVVKNGANSYVAVRLLEADDNGATTDLSDCDYIQIIGNINPEGGPMPDPIRYDPDKIYNKTQIFRTSLSITGTAMSTTLRTGDEYKETKREAMQMHSIEMERAFLWGVMSETVGNNSKPERTTMGLIPCIKTYAPTNVANYALDSAYSGNSWLASGEEWLNNKLEVIFRYGNRNKMAFAGSGAILGINRLAMAGSTFQMSSTTKSYGINVVDWVTPFGTLSFMTHPLFSYDVTTRNTMVIFEPEMLKYRYLKDRDTKFFPDDGRHGASRVDGINEEWLTECGLEFHHPIKFGYLSGFNTDSLV